MERNSTNHSLDNLTERFQSLTERKKVKLRVVEPLKSLPNWPSAIRGTPNACLRSALFAGIQGKERIAYKKRTLLAAVDGIEVRYLAYSSINRTSMSGCRSFTCPVNNYRDLA